MRKTRLHKWVNNESYKTLIALYKEYKTEGNIDKLLFFKSFVYICSDYKLFHGFDSFNGFLSPYKTNIKALKQLIEELYFTQYKNNGYIDLYLDTMTKYTLK